MKEEERIGRIERYLATLEFLKQYRFTVSIDGRGEPLVTFDSISNEAMKKLVKHLNTYDLNHILVEDKSRKKPLF